METKTTSNRMLRLKAVCDLTGLSRSSIYLKITDGEFPAPVKLGKRSVGWIEIEVSQWIENRINQSRPIAPECKSILTASY